MDPVTIAVVAALAALGNASLGEAGRRATADAYEALKRAIKSKLGDSHPAPQLIETLEVLPASGAGTEAVKKELGSLSLSADPEILAAAKQIGDTLSINIGSLSHHAPKYEVHASNIGLVGDHNKATIHQGYRGEEISLNGPSAFDLPPLHLGEMLRPLLNDDLLSEMLDDTRF